ncbi:hypothetical protein F4679DRAFT_585548 [Xylaria curta]|nr:hypothetical protein F4679DRAFT_585548 [Xylaria curta]
MHGYAGHDIFIPALPPNIGVAIITTTNSSAMVLSSILVRSLMHPGIPMMTMTASKRMSHVSATAAHCSLKGIFAFLFQTVGTESATPLVAAKKQSTENGAPGHPPGIAFEICSYHSVAPPFRLLSSSLTQPQVGRSFKHPIVYLGS